MVKGGLLTAHTGGVHVYGWSPGGGFSFRQGAGAASPGSIDLETAAAVEQRGSREKGIRIGVSTPRGKYRRGESRGPTRKPGGLLARPRVGPRQGPSWSLVVPPPPLPPLVTPESSLTLIFNIYFSEFFGHL